MIRDPLQRAIEPDPVIAPKSEPVVSVVIPSYNSSRYIRECLAALRAQETELAYEIIVVDSSDDGTERVVQREFPEVRLLRQTQRCSAGHGRNIGIQQARGRVVLFLDTDCIAPSDWVQRMHAAIVDHGRSAVCGSLANGTPWSVSGCVGYYLEFFRFLPHDGPGHESWFLVTGNSGFSRDVFERIQFNDASVGEDFALGADLKRDGKPHLFLPSVSVRHMNKTGLGRVFRYQYKLGQGAYRYRRHFSPRVSGWLRRVPPLALLMPNLVMPWVGSVVLRRRGMAEFLKFLVLLPVTYAANMAWAVGFYRAIRERAPE